MPGCLVCTLPFSAPRDAMLTMFVHATYFFSMHLYTLTDMSMHESCLLVCRPCFNTMKLWIFDPNLNLSLVDTTFCLLSCSFAFLLVCLLSCFLFLPCLSCLSTLCLFHMPYTSLSFHCLSASFLFLPLHVHTWSEDA